MPDAPLTLLLVDDNPLDRETCRRLLRQARPGRFRFVEAGTVGEGLALVEAETPWCVLVDYQLPDQDGLSFVERLGALGHDLPVVMLTGTGNEVVAVEAMKRGVQDYVPKNLLDAPLLVRAVENAVEKHRLQRLVERHQRETEAANARLTELNAALEARVARRTAELSAAHADLQARNEELQEFAYVASHDLQEPLRKIRTFASLLVHDYAPDLPEEAGHFIGRMSEAAERMAQLLTDLLSYSRAATQTTTFTDVDLDETVASVLGDLELLLRETQADVVVGDLCTIEASATQMRQLFQNLIANAVKFRRADAAPRIRVTASQVPGATPMCRIVVEDDGIGFDARHADRIFGPFQRLHGMHQYPGTGMGLAICRRLVQRHHGTITAASPPGTGARFEVLLPMRQTSTAAAPAVPEGARS